MTEQEPATWYRTRASGGYDIEEVKVSKQSAQCIWVGNEWNGRRTFRRQFIKSSWENFWPTKQEAIEFLIERAKDKIRSAEHTITITTGELEKLTQQQQKETQ